MLRTWLCPYLSCTTGIASIGTLIPRHLTWPAALCCDEDDIVAQKVAQKLCLSGVQRRNRHMDGTPDAVDAAGRPRLMTPIRWPAGVSRHQGCNRFLINRALPTVQNLAAAWPPRFSFLLTKTRTAPSRNAQFAIRTDLKHRIRNQYQSMEDFHYGHPMAAVGRTTPPSHGGRA